MKLRLRSLKNRDTMTLVVPVPCSLQQLKIILSQRIPSSPHPDSLHLSLNRKDEIQSPSPNEETLQALGIASGDLIFYFVGPNCFSPETLHTGSDSQPPVGLQERQTLSKKAWDLQNPLHSHGKNIDEAESSRQSSLDGMYIDDSGKGNDGKFTPFSVPGFLKKVFDDELVSGDDPDRCHKLLVTAVHAVLLESGFVGFDMNLKTEISGCPFQADKASNLSLFYTLPGLIGNALPISECHNGVVVLKFQSIGRFLNVYGSLEKASGVHSVRIREDELLPFLNVAWANCGLSDDILSRVGLSWTSPAKEVVKFWNTVKDELALPLLMDLCERAGLELPTCFRTLPTEVKLKIIESLVGVDIARLSCVSSEFHNLCSDDDLWKQKFVQDFSSIERCLYPYECFWKLIYGDEFKKRKSRKLRIGKGMVGRVRGRSIFGAHIAFPIYDDIYGIARPRLCPTGTRGRDRFTLF